jgi:hypothetical protein
MEKKITKEDKEWDVFQDIWKYYSKFAIPENNDQYWDDLIKAGEEIVHKHDSDTLCVRLVSAVMMTMNDRIKNG